MVTTWVWSSRSFLTSKRAPYSTVILKVITWFRPELQAPPLSSQALPPFLTSTPPLSSQALPFFPHKHSPFPHKHSPLSSQAPPSSPSFLTSTLLLFHTHSSFLTSNPPPPPRPSFLTCTPHFPHKHSSFFTSKHSPFLTSTPPLSSQAPPFPHKHSPFLTSTPLFPHKHPPLSSLFPHEHSPLFPHKHFPSFHTCFQSWSPPCADWRNAPWFQSDSAIWLLQFASFDCKLTPFIISEHGLLLNLKVLFRINQSFTLLLCFNMLETHGRLS